MIKKILFVSLLLISALKITASDTHSWVIKLTNSGININGKDIINCKYKQDSVGWKLKDLTKTIGLKYRKDNGNLYENDTVNISLYGAVLKGPSPHYVYDENGISILLSSAKSAVEIEFTLQKIADPKSYEPRGKFDGALFVDSVNIIGKSAKELLTLLPDWNGVLIDDNTYKYANKGFTAHIEFDATGMVMKKVYFGWFYYGFGISE